MVFCVPPKLFFPMSATAICCPWFLACLPAKAGRWHEIDTELHIGAWINVRDEARRTVLLWAARYGNSEAVTDLVSKMLGL